MKDLGVDLKEAQGWFQHQQQTPYVLVSVSEQQAKTWAATLGLPVRRCYMTDAVLSYFAAQKNRPEAEIIASKLPDPGAVMSGDFGEILVYLYQGAHSGSESTIGATKWRLKQDRQKPAPHSDVIHFVVPNWPAASSNDAVLCSEVKTKATAGASTPIQSAIADCQKDRTSRLAKTLVWLRERAYTDDCGDLSLAHLERFIDATDHPAAQKKYSAVAVVSSELVNAELAGAPNNADPEYTVVVISVPELKACYTAVFDAARQAVAVADAKIAAGGAA